ncbi:helix-turn-helix domain-containing protein [Paraburkholderia acidisoli]|uniref:Helix-turn-helix domain-containing protein n=1 Tax=Paraburkholderia acidisoli TaxID=2571748 RepID=A0A7Z2JFS3_9BURK|nr:helix-turn-helix domain-containing protein [Paraburkholderia acidisoli]QGZ63757.1 helix-turn-helix domain-containing protein [Paraburkholderia acidisoli]
MNDEANDGPDDREDQGDESDQGVDPVLVAVLEQLWRAEREARTGDERARRAWSLAKLSKQSGVPMSGLRRQLTALVDSGLVVTTFAEDGSGSASLSEDGRTFCAEVFGEGDEGGEGGTRGGEGSPREN